MPAFYPFQGLRFQADDTLLSALICPPYDIIDSEERARLIEANKDNIVSVELPAGGDDRYDQSAAHLRDMLSSSLLHRDEEPHYYIYRMRFDHAGEIKDLHGIVGLIGLTPFSEGQILPHETTLSKAKEDRLSLLKATHANISPIYTLFSDEEGIARAAIQKAVATPPLSDVVFDGVTHTLFALPASEAEALERFFEPTRMLIADGHHRYETALNFKSYLTSLGHTVTGRHPANAVLAVSVPLEDPGLLIFPTHRMVLTKEHLSFDSLKPHFSLTPLQTAKQAEVFLKTAKDAKQSAFIRYDGSYLGIALEDRSYIRSLSPEKSTPYQELDVHVLHAAILRPLFSIDTNDLASGKSLLYTRDTDEAIRQVDSGLAACSFLLNPPEVSDVLHVTENGEQMPQKSTYFYPKWVTGLVMNQMEDFPPLP